tara:strand:+ start:33 stop:440 length:408 start_codon:yes stop_codon:yes gene_type:complete
MVDEEKKKEKVEEVEEKEKATWSMADLIALTDEVQHDELAFRDKIVKFQFCELTEKEEPKMKALSRTASEADKMTMYQELGSERCLKMILKANKKYPEGCSIDEHNWENLPTTLRYQIANKIMGVEGDVKENFTL